MQQYSQYPFASNEQPRKKDRTGMVVIGTMMFFMVLGFIAGLVILAVRNAYLFS